MSLLLTIDDMETLWTLLSVVAYLKSDAQSKKSRLLMSWHFISRRVTSFAMNFYVVAFHVHVTTFYLMILHVSSRNFHVVTFYVHVTTFYAMILYVTSCNFLCREFTCYDISCSCSYFLCHDISCNFSVMNFHVYVTTFMSWHFMSVM